METETLSGAPDVVVIGAGFAGMYALYKLREAGFSTVVLEAAPDVGGTWYHNRYPGLRCDIESLEYQYSWSKGLRDAWAWSEKYPPQPDILSYARWVADRLDLRDGITFNTRMSSAVWNEDDTRWRVTAEDGRIWTPRFVILGTGALSVPRYPDIPGRDRIREAVNNPDLAECLCPSDFIGARRICVDTGYYEIFNRENVALVDVRNDGIASFSEKGLTLESGVVHEFDVLILATGYDAMTGAILSLDLRGVEDTPIQAAWGDGPKTYLGLGVAGFPNMFTVTGPGSPSVLSNVLRSIEHHVEWITDCLTDLRRRDATRIEIADDAQEDWVSHVRDVADGTIYTKAASWYMGSNVPGKPRVFMPYAGGLPQYRQICEDVARDDYRGFHIS